jgi:hypothetical protein
MLSSASTGAGDAEAVIEADSEGEDDAVVAVVVNVSVPLVDAVAASAGDELEAVALDFDDTIESFDVEVDDGDFGVVAVGGEVAVEVELVVAGFVQVIALELASRVCGELLLASRCAVGGESSGCKDAPALCDSCVVARLNGETVKLDGVDAVAVVDADSSEIDVILPAARLLTSECELFRGLAREPLPRLM